MRAAAGEAADDVGRPRPCPRRRPGRPARRLARSATGRRPAEGLVEEDEAAVAVGQRQAERQDVEQGVDVGARPRRRRAPGSSSSRRNRRGPPSPSPSGTWTIRSAGRRPCLRGEMELAARRWRADVDQLGARSAISASPPGARREGAHWRRGSGRRRRPARPSARPRRAGARLAAEQPPRFGGEVDVSPSGSKRQSKCAVAGPASRGPRASSAAGRADLERRAARAGPSRHASARAARMVSSTASSPARADRRTSFRSSARWRRPARPRRR